MAYVIEIQLQFLSCLQVSHTYGTKDIGRKKFLILF